MVSSTVKISDLRPGMDHLNLRVKVTSLKEVRTVKTYTGLEHSLLEGEVSDGEGTIGFVVWNEKIDLFSGLRVGDTVEMTNAFVTSFRGILQVNVGRDSDAKKSEA